MEYLEAIQKIVGSIPEEHLVSRLRFNSTKYLLFLFNITEDELIANCDPDFVVEYADKLKAEGRL